MNEQRMNRRTLLMREIFEQFSYDLSRINITIVQMTNDFIVFVDSQRRLIAIFVHVFVNILNDFYDRAYLHVDVTFVSQRQIRIIRNNSTIIHNEFSIVRKLNDSRTFVVSSFVSEIFVFFDYDEFQKRLRIMLETDVIIRRSASHTYRDEICEFARFVCHLFLNDISQFFRRIQDRVRQFRTYDVVNSFRSHKSIFRSQKHQ
jgi:hypothetical protein